MTVRPSWSRLGRIATLFVGSCVSLILFQNCGDFSSSPSSAQQTNPPGPGPTGELPVQRFSLEPSNNNLVVAVGQEISIYAPFYVNTSDPFPVYVSGSQISWSSSAAGVASVSSTGVVTGVTEGAATVSAVYTYQGQQFTSRVALKVAGRMTRRTINVPGQRARSYLVYSPFSSPDSMPRPVLLSLHGGGGNASLQAASSLLNSTAQVEKFYVLYPEGTGAIQTFNAGACCGTAQTQNVNDVQYINAILDDFGAAFAIDSQKVYATGFSNGAIMTHRLACELSNRISGIAAVSGGSGEFDGNLNRYFQCTPARPIPVLLIHASNDRNYPIAGGVGEGASGTPFYSIAASVSDWRVRNNVGSQAVIESVTPTTACYHYRNSSDAMKPSATVSLCVTTPSKDIFDSNTGVVFGGGHSWPGGSRSPNGGSDTPVGDFSASNYLWKYLNP